MSEDQSPIEFEIYMTDVTLNESDGVFDVANSIMNKHSCNAKRNEWFIRSNIGVLNNFGYNEFVCQFDNNKNVFIVSYSPVIRDTFYNVDIRCFSQWCMQKGWFSKDGSKWRTMPELMLRYRAASFFGRLYAPDILYGMQTTEEVEDAKFTEIEEERPRVKLQQQVTTQSIVQESPRQPIEMEAEEVPDPGEESATVTPVEEIHAEVEAQPEPPKRTRKAKQDPEPEPVEEALFPIPEQPAASEEMEIMDPPPADFVDADEIIFFMQDSEDLADFERKRQLVKTSFNKLPQAQRNKVIDAMEKFKAILKGASDEMK